MNKNITSQQSLETLLHNAGVPIHTWGTGHAKQVADLYQEILDGETQLIDSAGTLIRKIEGVAADVYYQDENILYRLKEEKQVFSDGRVREREFTHAVSEKMKPGEDIIMAVQRGIAEELGITTPINISLTGVETEEHDSPSYPGLFSQYIRNTVTVRLTKEQFHKDGYVEYTPTLTTYFVWEKQ